MSVKNLEIQVLGSGIKLTNYLRRQAECNLGKQNLLSIRKSFRDTEGTKLKSTNEGLLSETDCFRPKKGQQLKNCTQRD